ncbi:MAG: DUF2270 domain-containing protein [Chloroflexi bacterium]|nr:MAG: DUF2270 domain-containing protein [Chloroflexota bacterium]
MPDEQTPDSEQQKHPEPIWTFRGYELSASDLNTAMAHLYRGEVQRSNTWRTRLDSTTNWAVVTTAAALSLAFGAPTNPHVMIILTTILVTVFLYIESRRYRYYELWTWRVRLMETDFFAAMLVPPYCPDEDWARELAGSLLRPEFPISEMEALGRRFRRNYAVLFFTLALAWVVKVAIHPVPVHSWQEFVINAGIGPVPGELMIALGALFNIGIFAIGWLTAEMHEAPGEVLPRYPSPLGPGRLIDNIAEAAQEFIPEALHRVPRRHQLAYIITDKSQHLAERLMRDLARGVTALTGIGMYTGKQHTVLLCAVAPTQVAQLKNIVRETDSDAFVIITSAYDVMGRGFTPIKKEGRETK